MSHIVRFYKLIIHAGLLNTTKQINFIDEKKVCCQDNPFYLFPAIKSNIFVFSLEREFNASGRLTQRGVMSRGLQYTPTQSGRRITNDLPRRRRFFKV